MRASQRMEVSEDYLPNRLFVYKILPITMGCSLPRQGGILCRYHNVSFQSVPDEELVS